MAEAAAASAHVQVYFDAEAPGSSVRCLFRIEEQSELLRDLLCSALLLNVVRRCWRTSGRGRHPVHRQPPHATYRFPYHQDNAYQFYHPPRSLAATLALDAQGEDSGPISFLRGSHELPILPHEPSGVLGASRGLVDPPDTARYPEVAATVEAGDVLVHHANVIHRTGPNRTGSHRRNLGFTYHGAGASRTRRPTPSPSGWSSATTVPTDRDSWFRRRTPRRTGHHSVDRNSQTWRWRIPL